MNRMIIFVAAVCLCIPMSVTVYSQRKSERVSPKGSKEQKIQRDWHENWELFLRAYQDCCNDQSCTFDKFHGQTFSWEGKFVGIGKTDKGEEVANIELTPGTIIDRKGQTVKVINSLTLKPADLEAWRKLTVGENIHFRIKNLSNDFGASFIPVKDGCCFMVMVEGKADLLPGSTRPMK